MFYQIASKHFQLIDHLPLLLSTQSNPLWYDLSHLPRNPKLGGVVHPQTSSCQQTFCDWSQSWASLSWLIRVEQAFYDWSELSKPFVVDQSWANLSWMIKVKQALHWSFQWFHWSEWMSASLSWLIRVGVGLMEVTNQWESLFLGCIEKKQGWAAAGGGGGYLASLLLTADSWELTVAAESWQLIAAEREKRLRLAIKHSPLLLLEFKFSFALFKSGQWLMYVWKSHTHTQMFPDLNLCRRHSLK